MRFLLRRTGWIVLLCACPTFTAAEIPHPACVPTGEVKALLETHFEGGSDEMLPLIEAALVSHPGDVHLGRQYQDMYRGEDEELLERYRADAAARPGDPAALYLYGRLQDRLGQPAAEATLRAALEIDPVYPWAHFALSHFYNTVQKDPERFQAHLAAAIDQCPNSNVLLARLGALPKDEVERRAAALRARLADSRDPALATLLGATWTAEFQVLPPSAHGALRDRIRSDLAWLRGPGLVEDRRALDALLQGYRIVGDDAGLDWAIAETARRFPDDTSARGAAFERFRERHSPPEDECDVAASRVFYEELSLASRRWTELWPSDPGVRFARLQAMVHLPDVPAEQLTAEIEVVRVAAAGRERIAPGTPMAFQIAEMLVESARALDRVPSLVEAGRAEIRSRATNGEPAEEDPTREAFGLAIQVQARLQLGELDAARADFAELARIFPIDPGPRTLTPEQEAGWKKHSAIEAVLQYQPRTCRPEDETAYLRVAEILAPELAEVLTLNRMPVPGRRRLDGFEERSIPLSDFALQDLGGRTWHLSDLRGKVTLIHVWMYELGMTRAMLPWMEELGARMRGRPDFVLLTLSVDDKLDKLEPMMRDNGFTFPVVPARDYVWKLLDKSPGLPTTWIVDRNGTIVRESGGFGGDKDGWIDVALQAIEEVAAEAPSDAGEGGE